MQPGPKRGVGEALVAAEHVVGLRPPQQVGSGRAGLVPESEAVEAPVGQADHAGPERAEHLCGERLLAGRARAHGDVDERVGAALGEADEPQLGEGAHPLAPSRSGAAERRRVGRRVRDVQAGPVDGDDPPSPPERAPGSGVGQRGGHLVEQRLERLGSQPGPGLEQRRLGRHVPALRPSAGPRQTLDEHAHDLLVGGLAEQGQRHDVVDDHPSRQQPVTLLEAAGIGHDPIDQLRGKHPREHPDRDVIRQSLVVLRLDPPGAWHGRQNNTSVVLSKRYWL